MQVLVFVFAFIASSVVSFTYSLRYLTENNPGNFLHETQISVTPSIVPFGLQQEESGIDQVLGLVDVTLTPSLNPTPSLALTLTPTKKPTVTPTLRPTVTVTLTPTQIITSTPTLMPILSPTLTLAPQPNYTSQEINGFIDRFGAQYAVDPNVLRHIAVCESGFNPQAVNGPYAGLYQFSSSTWSSNRSLIGEDTNPELRFNAEEAVQTAAYMLSVGKGSAWANCLP